MNKLKELHKQFKDIVKYVPTYCVEQYEEFQKYSELCGLVNAVANLSDRTTARALDETVKEIAYASTEPNFEVQERYLREAVMDLAGGMDATDMILKYEDILYRCKGWL